MGKVENIKRAKRLKEAKRKREIDALVAEGYGPAGIEIKKRNEKDGWEMQVNDGKIKYSELLMSFVQPLLEEDDTADSVKSKCLFAAQAWNAEIIRKKNKKEFVSIKKSVCADFSDSKDFEMLFDELTKRKAEDFAIYKNLIVDVEMKKNWGRDYELSVATMPFDVE